MDPKLSGLDPKLREAYERVMNGPAPASPVPQPGSVNPPQPTPPPAPANPAPVNPAPPPPPTPAPALSSNFNFNSNFSSNQNTQTSTTVKKAGGKLSSVLIILGLIVLLVAYTFVWVYLFDLKIPFLPF